MKSIAGFALVVAILVGGSYALMSMNSGPTMQKEMMEKRMEKQAQNDASSMGAGAMMKKDDSSSAMAMDSESSSEEVIMKKETSYGPFSAGVIGNGETSLLFFHASWCPACRKADQELTALYQEQGRSISTYKVDYDSSAELKTKYGITQQHTFVLIDGQGNALKTMIGGTKDDLAMLVK